MTDGRAQDDDDSGEMGGAGGAGSAGTGGGGEAGQSPEDGAVADPEDADDPEPVVDSGAQKDGSADAAPDSSPPIVDAGPCVANCARVQHYTTITATTTDKIQPHLRIINTSGSALQLKRLTMRYWYSDTGTGEVITCYNPKPCTAALKIVPVSPARTGASRYLEVAFVDGEVPANGTSDGYSVQVRHTGVNYNQADDYSFAANASYVDWPKVTMYLDGKLHWGTSPNGDVAPGSTIPSHEGNPRFGCKALRRRAVSQGMHFRHALGHRRTFTLVTLLALPACGKSATLTAPATPAQAQASQNESAPSASSPPSAEQTGSYMSQRPSAAPSSAMAMPARMANGAPSSAIASGPANPVMLDIEATLDIEVGRVPDAAARIRDIVQNQGGVFTSDCVTDQSGRLEGNFDVRVDAEKTAQVIEALAALGRVKARDLRAKDVSKEYFDSTILLQNLQATLARYQQILSRANDVKDMLQIEAELARVRQEIERVEGSLRWMKDRVSRSTIHVHVQEPRVEIAKPAPIEPEPSAKFHPGARAVYLVDVRGHGGAEGLAGGAMSVQFSRSFRDGGRLHEEGREQRTGARRLLCNARHRRVFRLAGRGSPSIFESISRPSSRLRAQSSPGLRRARRRCWAQRFGRPAYSPSIRSSAGSVWSIPRAAKPTWAWNRASG